MKTVSKEPGIYVFVWTENKYFYIGQSQNLRKRKNEHLNLLKNKKHSNTKFQNVYNKYGEPHFEIIEECIVDELNQREQFFLDLLIEDLNCLNIARCAEAPRRGLGDNKMRISVTISPQLLDWWKENSTIPVSAFLEAKMKQFSSSFKPREEVQEKLKGKISLDNISWVKKGEDK